MRLSTPLMGAVPRTNANKMIEKPKALQENRLIRIDNVMRFYMRSCRYANVWFALWRRRQRNRESQAYGSVPDRRVELMRPDVHDQP